MNNLKKIKPATYLMPQEGNMHVPGLIIATEELFQEMDIEKPLDQVRNVAHLQGIVGYSIAMPDIHWGYGFPIGGVAAMDAESGVISPGVFKAFENHESKKGVSFRDQLKNIAGSSVGALSALIIAVGTPSKEFINETDGLDFEKLLGKGHIFKDGKPLLDFMRKIIKKNMTTQLKGIFKVDDLKHINENKLEEFKNKREKETGTRPQVDWKKIKNVIEALGNPNIENMSISFSMLSILHELEPKVFKNLTVTATCRENGKTFYFDSEKTPDLDIALACRASASLPIVLQPVTIEGRFLNPGYAQEVGNTFTFVDGGYLDNIPVSAMHDKQGKKGNHRGEAGQNLHTLALVFDETGRNEKQQSPFMNVNAKAKKHIFYNSSSWKNRLIRDLFAKMVAGINTNERNTLKKEDGLNEIQLNYTQRNIPLLVGIKTTDFKKASRVQKEYTNKGYVQAMEYLQNHKEELIYRSFDRIDDLLQYAPPAMHDKIIAFQKQNS